MKCRHEVAVVGSVQRQRCELGSKLVVRWRPSREGGGGGGGVYTDVGFEEPAAAKSEDSAFIRPAFIDLQLQVRVRLRPRRTFFFFLIA
jgi:hypothetical protein